MDLDRDARRILDLATDARAPAVEDKARVEKKLGALLGVSVVAIAGQEAATQAAHAASSASDGANAASSAASSAASGVALKWWVAAAAVAATTYAAVMNLAPAPKEPPAKPAIAAQPSTLPEEEAVPAAAPPIKEAAPAPVLPGPLPDAPQRPAHAIAPKKHAARNTLGQELELLHRAQAAWRAHDAGDALTLIDEHRARFPRSELWLERDGLRVLTLCGLGRKAEATTLARKLLERAPRSPLRATIEESCALK